MQLVTFFFLHVCYSADTGRPIRQGLPTFVNPKSALQISQCELEIGENNSGRYPIGIAAAFPKGIIRLESSPRNPTNVHCKCHSYRWAICHIIVQPGSLEEAVVLSKMSIIHPETGELDPPFTIFQSQWDVPKIVFTEHDAFAGLKVWAEIQVVHPDVCIPQRMCTSPEMQGTLPICPVLFTPFTDGESVFVPIENSESIKRGRRSRCISTMGLRQIAAEAQSLGHTDGFIDPLEIVAAPERVKMSQYAGVFLVVSNEDFDNGLCDPKSTPIPSVVKDINSQLAGTLRRSGGSWLATDSTPGSSSQAGTSVQKTNSETAIRQIEGASNYMQIFRDFLHQRKFTFIFFIILIFAIHLLFPFFKLFLHSKGDRVAIYELIENV